MKKFTGKKIGTVANLIVLLLIIIFLGKVFFSSTDMIFLYLYGLLVMGVTIMIFAVTFSRYRDPYLVAKSHNVPGKNYMVSCIVAVKNEEDFIEKCVESLINQDYKNKEIIIVNDGSTDKTADVLEKYSKSGAITLLNLKENIGKKKAISIAIGIARGNIFAFSDSDSVLAHDAVSKIVKAMEFDPLIGGVSGHCRAMNAEKNILTKAQDSWYEGQFSVKKAFESVFGAVSCVSGPLAVFRREAIYNFIPAWEKDQFLGQEFRFATDRTLTGFVLGSKSVGKRLKEQYKDSLFVKRVDYPLRDWKIVYCKSARAWTNVPDTFKKFILQQIRWKKSFVRNTFFTGSFYWKKQLPAVAYYYLHVFFVLLGPFIAFRHLVYLPLQGNADSAILYVSGIVFVGLMYGLAYKIENRDCNRWIYRPIMSILSTMMLCYLLFFSVLTIKKNKWVRS